MNDTIAPGSQTDPIVGALRELSQAFQQQALAVSVIAREGAIAAETAERAENAARQALVIAREVRDTAKKIDRKLESLGTDLEAHRRAFEEFFVKALKEFGDVSTRVKVLEDAREAGSNGHG